MPAGAPLCMTQGMTRNSDHDLTLIDALESLAIDAENISARIDVGRRSGTPYDALGDIRALREKLDALTRNAAMQAAGECGQYQTAQALGIPLGQVRTWMQEKSA